MSVDNFSQLMVKLEDQPIQEAKLMGMGEPFLHPQFFAITRKFKETFPNAKLISATNAQYSLTQNVIDSLRYIDMLYISIDGANDNYERLRPPSKWSKLITFLQNLQYVDRHKCEIVINYTISPGIVYDIPIIENLAKEYLDGVKLLEKKRHWHEHINFFNQGALEALMASVGLSLLSIVSHDIQIESKSYTVFMLACMHGEA